MIQQTETREASYREEIENEEQLNKSEYERDKTFSLIIEDVKC